MFTIRRYTTLLGVLVICMPAILLVGCSGTRSVTEETSENDSTVVDARTTNDYRAKRRFIQGLTYAFLEEYDRAIVYYQQALATSSDKAAIYSALAKAYAQKNSLSTAVSYARKAVAADSERIFYYYQLAELQRQSNEPAAAIDTYRRILEQFPGEKQALYSLASLQARTGSLQEAIDTYRRLLDRRGRDIHVQYQLLRLYRQQNDAERVIQTLEAIVQETGFNSDIYKMLGDMYRQQGHLKEAARVFEIVLQHDARDAGAALELANLYERLGQPAKADSLMQRTLETGNMSADALFERAQTLYFQSGGSEQANQAVKQLLNQVLQKQPEHAEALFLLGTLYMREQDYKQAVDLLYRSAEYNPRNRSAWIRAAAAALHGGQYERTIELANEALILFPGQFSLLRMAGYASARSGRDEKAVDYLSRALESGQSEEVNAVIRSEIAAMLGMLYDRLGKTAASDSIYAQAIAWNEKNSFALNNYAYSLAQRGRKLDKALEMAQQAVALDPGNAAFLDTLGWIYFKRNNYDKAAHWTHKAIQTGDASAVVHEHYGDILHQLGNDKKALEFWRKAANMNPDRASAGRKIQRLKSAP